MMYVSWIRDRIGGSEGDGFRADPFLFPYVRVYKVIQVIDIYNVNRYYYVKRVNIKIIMYHKRGE